MKSSILATILASVFSLFGLHQPTFNRLPYMPNHAAVAAAVLATSDQPSAFPASAGATSTVINQYITNPVIERVVQTPDLSAPTLSAQAGYVTEGELEAKLQAFRNSLPLAVYSPVFTSPPASGGFGNEIALTNRIDQLTGTSLTDISVDGVSGLTDADIPDNITASNYLPLTGGTLTGGLVVGGNFTAGTLSFSAASSTSLVAQDATITAATSTSLFSSFGNFTTAIANTFTASVANVVGLTATNATTTNLGVTGTGYFAGNVGIGTTSPSTPLVIDSASVNGSILRLSNASTGGHIFDLLSTGSGNTGGAGRLDVFDRTAGLARFSISANGNVGIGTTSPPSTLSVGGSGYFTNSLGIGTSATPIGSPGLTVAGTAPSLNLVETDMSGNYFNTSLNGGVFSIAYDNTTVPLKIDSNNQNRVTIQRLNSSPNDFTVLYVPRIANHAGGTSGFVNSAGRFEDIISAGNTNYEWGLVSTITNNSTAADGSQNVSFYGQSIKNSTGATWASTFELRDENPDPTRSSVGTEMDIWGNGTDANSNRIILNLVGGPIPGSSLPAPTIGYGLAIGAVNGVAADATFGTGLVFSSAGWGTLIGTHGGVTATHGVDLSGFTFSSDAFKSGGFIVTGAGHVGIGTTTPSDSLDVVGGSNSVIQITGNNPTYNLLSSSQSNLWKIQVLDSDNSMRFLVGGSDRLHIQSNGNVGLSSSSPATTFSVSGNGYFTGGLGVGVVNTGSGTLQSTGDATIGGNETIANNLSVTGTAGTSTIAAGQGFTIGSSQFVVQQGTGFVGIGTSSPSASLSIQGSELISSASPVLDLQSSSKLWRLQAVNGAQFRILEGGTAERFTVAVGGNVGIGNTAPTYNLDVTGNGHFTAGLDAQYLVATSSSIASIFNGGFLSLASSTIGAGTQTGGLTISGGATTTGNAYFAGNVGIGTMSPTFPLQVVANVAGVLTTEIQNVHNTTAADVQLFLGTRATVGDTNVGASIYADRTDAAVAGDTDLLFKNSSGTTLNTNLVVKANGNVGIGTTSPTTALQVNGVITPNADNTSSLGNATYRWSTVYSANGTIQTSDERLKTNITDLDYGLSDLLKLRPVSFTWTAQPQQGTQLGFIAQDVKPLFPEIVNVGDDPNHTLGLTYTEFIPVIVKSIQQLAEQISGFADSFTTKELTFTRATGDEVDVHRVVADELCAKKSDGTNVCVTGDQLAAAISGASTSAPATDNGATPDSTQPTIAINGDNPAYINVGDSYADLGATVTGPQADLNLGIRTFLNGQFTSDIVLDTSAAATDTIDYVATDQNGLTATTARMIIIEAAPSSPSDASPTLQ